MRSASQVNAGPQVLPRGLKIAYTLMVAVIVPVYWHDLGPTNFLWFSDIALIALVPALWWESRLLASTMAVAVLLLEVGWIIDFFAGGHLLGIARYMFEDETRTHIRILSGLFHIVMPCVLLYMLLRLGYDRRAPMVQTLLMLIVVPVTYLLSPVEENINWVFGPAERQELLPPLVYLALLMLAFVVLVYLPSHLLFRKIFPHPSPAWFQRLRR